ncbi:MAG: hypothetical protein V1685_02275 [Parcubacteria group bacterium]
MQFLKGFGLGLMGAIVGACVLLTLILLTSSFGGSLELHWWIGLGVMAAICLMLSFPRLITWLLSLRDGGMTPLQLFLISTFGLSLSLIFWMYGVEWIVEVLELRSVLEWRHFTLAQLILTWLTVGVATGAIAQRSRVF